MQPRYDLSPSGAEASTAEILPRLERLGYSPETDLTFRVGRPDRATLALRAGDGSPVVAKVYPDGNGEQAWANMLAVWDSSFGERRDPPGLPRPLDYRSELGVIVTERLPGRPLLELGRQDARSLTGVLGLLGDLHESDARPAKKRPARRVLRSVRRKVDCIVEAAPEFGREAETVYKAMAAAEPVDEELVPSHGDFSARNVLVAEDRRVLIDWDRLQLANPERDVAYLAASGWVWALRGAGQWEQSILDEIPTRYRELRANPPALASFDFHVAAALMRIACGLVTLWPSDAHLVPALMREALRRLG